MCSCTWGQKGGDTFITAAVSTPYWDFWHRGGRGHLHGVLLPVDGVLRAGAAIVAPVQVELHGLVTGAQASTGDDAQVRNADLDWIRREGSFLFFLFFFKEGADGKKRLTRVSVVLDGALEDLLVVLELERGQAIVSHRLFSHDVDGRLVLSPAVPIGVGPLVRP